MNTEKTKKVSIDVLLILAAFLTALVIRLFHIGQAPLTDAEADLALQAFRLASGSSVELSGQPGYILPSTALFAIFGAGNGLARLVPALAGAFLALIPLFFRKELGSWAAVAISFGLALDPGLNALSRQASGVTWGLCFALLTLIGIKSRKPVLAGIALGLAILAGAPFWMGLIGAALGYGLFKLFTRRLLVENEESAVEEPQKPGFWLRALPWALGCLAIGGTLFFTVPRGISAASSGLTDFLSGWLGGATTQPASFLSLALVVYETFGLVFAFAQVIRLIFLPHKQLTDVFLVFWWFSALLLALIYPDRSNTGLAWTLIPMWALAARWLADNIRLKIHEHRLLTAIEAVVLFVLVTFAYLSLLGVLDLSKPPDEVRLRLFSAGGALLLSIAGMLLIGWGWSRAAARSGVVWASIALLGIWSLSATADAAGLGRYPEYQLWRSGAGSPEQDLLMKTIGDLSEWNTGERNGLDLAVIGISSPALEWSLRNFTSVSFYNVVPLGASPSLAVTRLQESPNLAATYSGQDFTWTTIPDWSGMTIPEWFEWAIYKTAPPSPEMLVLWVRTDRLPGGAETP